MSTTITTRTGKGSRLTFTEMDSNFTNLQITADAAATQQTTYTISQVDAAIQVEATRATNAEATLAPQATTYTISQVDAAIAAVSTSAIQDEVTRATAVEATLAPQATTYTKTETDSRIQAVVGAAPAALDTLAEIATQLASNETAVGALVTTIATKAPIENPTFTGTVSGITSAMVGLGNVSNTSDADKPVSTATALAIGVETDRAIAVEGTLAPQATTYTKTEVDAAIASAIAAFSASLYV